MKRVLKKASLTHFLISIQSTWSNTWSLQASSCLGFDSSSESPRWCASPPKPGRASRMCGIIWASSGTSCSQAASCLPNGGSSRKCGCGTSSRKTCWSISGVTWQSRIRSHFWKKKFSEESCLLGWQQTCCWRHSKMVSKHCFLLCSWQVLYVNVNIKYTFSLCVFRCFAAAEMNRKQF